MVMKSFAACEPAWGPSRWCASRREEQPRADASRRLSTATGLYRTSPRRGADRRLAARSCFGLVGNDSGCDPSEKRAREDSGSRRGAHAELLRRWLRDDVGVTQHVDSFESAFASGFLFGEILARCNVQPIRQVRQQKHAGRARSTTSPGCRYVAEGDFFEACSSMPPDPRAARGRADAPRASPTKRARPVTWDPPAKHRSVRSTRETSFGSLVSLVCRALALRLDAHALTPSLIIIRTSSSTTISRPCKRWASPWTRAR